MMAVEFDRPCADLVSFALKQRILVNVTAGNVLRLLPPLIFTDDEAQLLVDRVTAAVAEFEKDQSP
jgi:acetylornithine aminotransferase